MKMKFAIVALSVALSATVAHALGEDIISGMNVCTNHSSGDDAHKECARTAYYSADRLLNDQFKAVIEHLELLGDGRGVRLMREGESNWIQERNRACQASPDTLRTFDGRRLGTREYACFARQSVVRANELYEIPFSN